MQKFVHVKKKLRRILKWIVFETEEREEISPLPDRIREKTSDRVKACLSGSSILGLPRVEVEKEKKISKDESWSQNIEKEKKEAT